MNGERSTFIAYHKDLRTQTGSTTCLHELTNRILSGSWTSIPAKADFRIQSGEARRAGKEQMGDEASFNSSPYVCRVLWCAHQGGFILRRARVRTSQLGKSGYSLSIGLLKSAQGRASLTFRTRAIPTSSHPRSSFNIRLPAPRGHFTRPCHNTGTMAV